VSLGNKESCEADVPVSLEEEAYPVGATERLVLFPTLLMLELLGGAGHVEHPWVRTFSPH